MTDIDKEIIISKTKKWITNVVIGCNFCPFAAREVSRDSIHYEVLYDANQKMALDQLTALLHQLDNNKNIETTLLILPDSFTNFDNYLSLVNGSEKILKEKNYNGVYQIASFHPEYLFSRTSNNDPANYTNRSPYPMLHILREATVSKAIAGYLDIEKVPKRNIAFANEKGLAYMKQLLNSI